MTSIENYYGCWLTKNQLTEEEKKLAVKLPSMTRDKNDYRCNRCGSLIRENWLLPIGDYYCRTCLVFGRLTSGEELYYFPAQPFPKKSYLIWRGDLTSYQDNISKGLLKAWETKDSTLVHAVTGAGKTEMIYPIVEQVLANGGQVCLASPRIDVCRELYGRFKRDFSCSISLLYGDGDPYERCPLVISTTHQLMKFYRAFDLLIVDEVDAFPYVDNAMLYRATDLSVKEDGLRVFLTATSTDLLDKKVASGQLNRLRLARRFHGNPLVVPTCIWDRKFEKNFSKGHLSPLLKKEIAKQRKTGFPLLLFYPNIQEGVQFTELLNHVFPSQKIGFVSSQTENRSDIVQDFRQGQLDILVTTTILERGVTFPSVDVFVIKANHKLYSRSALVQISGRVGRSMDRPTGLLYFFHSGQTKAMQMAIAEIKAMNKEGGFG